MPASPLGVSSRSKSPNDGNEPNSSLMGLTAAEDVLLPSFELGTQPAAGTPTKHRLRFSNPLRPRRRCNVSLDDLRQTVGSSAWSLSFKLLRARRPRLPMLSISMSKELTSRWPPGRSTLLHSATAKRYVDSEAVGGNRKTTAAKKPLGKGKGYPRSGW
jgi:hypothetical protein